MTSVTLVAVGADGTSAVAARIGAFAKGLQRRGWHVDLVDSGPLSLTAAERLLSRVPSGIRSPLERAGAEGDVRPAIGRRARELLRDIVADAVVVSVPPFSLLQAVTAVDPAVTLVVDYRDPWNARRAAPPWHLRPDRSNVARSGGPQRSSTREGPNLAGSWSGA